MASINTKPRAPRTYEGGPALPNKTALHELKRATTACLLWEGTFYENGVDIATRIQQLSAQCDPRDLVHLAVELRRDHNLRHVPQLLLREACRRPFPGLKLYFPEIMRRPDDMTEFLALYWKDGKTPLAAQAKKGLALAFREFNAYQLAKYNRPKAIKLKDVMFMAHPKPDESDLTENASVSATQKYNKGENQVLRHLEGQGADWTALAANTLPTPDTWEVALSGGANKKNTFTRLLQEKKLGALALLRNLRNMHEANVDRALVRDSLLTHKGLSKVLPFRFIAAANAAPTFASTLDKAMQQAMATMPKLPGTTAVLVDHSGSMRALLSDKSDLSRSDAAIALAILINGIAEDVQIFGFHNHIFELPNYQGLALRDYFRHQHMGGTHLGAAVATVNQQPYDRIIVITDEQSFDRVGGPRPDSRGYMVNVATYKNGVGYGDWVRINGFSESVVSFIREWETMT